MTDDQPSLSRSSGRPKAQGNNTMIDTMNKSISSSIEQRSTLSILTNFYKKEESRRKARKALFRSNSTRTNEHVSVPSRPLASLAPFNNKQNVASNQTVLAHETNDPTLLSKPTTFPPLTQLTYILYHGEQQEEIANRQGKTTEADDIGRSIKKHTSGKMKKKRLAKDETNDLHQAENGICLSAFADGFNSKSTNKDIVTCGSPTAYSAGTSASTEWSESKYQRVCQQQQDSDEAKKIEKPTKCITSLLLATHPTTQKSSNISTNAAVDAGGNTASLVDATSSASATALESRIKPLFLQSDSVERNSIDYSLENTSFTTKELSRGPLSITCSPRLTKGCQNEQGLEQPSSKHKRLTLWSNALQNNKDNDDEFASVLMDSPSKQRKRLRFVGKSTKKRKAPDKKMPIAPSQSAPANEPVQRYDDNMWISSDTQGLVEMEELPINESVPTKRENPWTHLWQPGAEPFEMKFIFSQERRREA
jgi:hypothetical protein